MSFETVPARESEPKESLQQVFDNYLASKENLNAALREVQGLHGADYDGSEQMEDARDRAYKARQQWEKAKSELLKSIENDLPPKVSLQENLSSPEEQKVYEVVVTEKQVDNDVKITVSPASKEDWAFYDRAQFAHWSLSDITIFHHEIGKDKETLDEVRAKAEALKEKLSDPMVQKRLLDLSGEYNRLFEKREELKEQSEPTNTEELDHINQLMEQLSETARGVVEE